jgi:hypothetical protein
MIVEQEEVVELEEGQEFADLEATESPKEEEVQALEEETLDEVELPDKFKDKDIGDVVKSYQELEKEAGRRANEVGELRKLTDELLQLQLKEKQETVKESTQIDFDSLVENPTEAINKAVEDRFAAIEDQFTQQARNKGKQKFEANHPDNQELLQDPNFLSFIQSSKVRTRMFQEAHQNFDYDTADELFSMYKEIHGTAKEEAQEKATQKRTKKLQAAKTETGSTGAKSTKVYRRADLINLKLRDPARYEAMEDEIMLAYQEKRVK